MRIVRRSFGSMAGLLVGGAAAIYLTESTAIHLTAKTIESHRVIDDLNDTLSTIKDAETGQRGYLLTGKPQYLDPYRAAVSRVDSDLETIDHLADAGALSKPDVARLKDSTRKKLAELDQTIQLRSDKGFDAAEAVVESDLGKRLMDEIRKTTSGMIERQAAVLAHAEHQARLAGIWSTAIFIAVVAINLSFLVWAYRRIVREMRQRESANMELTRQKELLAVTLSSIGDGVIVTDTHATVTYVNPEAEKLTGWAGVDAMGQACAKVFNIINETSRKRVESPVDKVLRCGTVVGLANHTLLIRRDNLEIPIDDSGAPIRNSDGSIRGVVLVFRDFSEHKQGEKKLRDALFLLNTVTNSTQDLIYAKDRECRMLMANAATLGIVGRTLDQVIGRTESEWHDDPQQAAAIIETDRRIMASGKPEIVEEVFTGPLGRRVFRSTKSPLIDEKGHVFGIVGVTHDITDERKAEMELAAAKEAAESANIAKDNFLATLSHELRTPLSPVLATLNLWESGTDIPEALLADVRIMRRNVELEARLIDDLLDLTRIVKGKLPLNLETADIHALVESVASMYQSEMHGKRLSLTMQLNADQHHVRGDPARLQQVFWNIFKNATKFTPTGGKIEVASVNDPQGRIQLLFRDTGIGMTPETLSRLFEPFEQASDETLRHYGGLGLGMSISRSLMEAQGGVIAANSQGPGQGATFTVTLGCVAPPDSQSSAAMKTGEPPARSSLNILLVEDHADTARAMSRLLRSQGHAVRAANSVAEALQMAEQPFDLLLSDIGLPDGTGVDLIRQIRQQYGNKITAIALTGFGMEDDIAKCRAAGFNDHLTKPVNLQNLERMLQHVTAKG